MRADINCQLNRNDNKVDRAIFVAVHNDQALNERAELFYKRPSLFRNQSRMAEALQSCLGSLVRTREGDFWD